LGCLVGGLRRLLVKTPEDTELALAVVTDKFAAGTLTIAEASALVALIVEGVAASTHRTPQAMLISHQLKQIPVRLQHSLHA
jgi:hypothetical protein